MHVPGKIDMLLLNYFFTHADVDRFASLISFQMDMLILIFRDHCYLNMTIEDKLALPVHQLFFNISHCSSNAISVGPLICNAGKSIFKVYSFYFSLNMPRSVFHSYVLTNTSLVSVTNISIYIKYFKPKYF